jgi:hypothetical protein
MRPVRVAALLVTVVCSGVFAAREAQAEPQWNAGLILGVGGRGHHDDLWQRACFVGAFHGDVLFGQDAPLELGVGPYLDLATAGFSDVRPGAGLSLHVPLAGYLSSVVSAGGYARLAEGPSRGGVSSRLFLGPRSHNFHGNYAVSGGLVLALDYGLGRYEETLATIALQLDGEILSLPILAAYTWLTH